MEGEQALSVWRCAVVRPGANPKGVACLSCMKLEAAPENQPRLWELHVQQIEIAVIVGLKNEECGKSDLRCMSGWDSSPVTLRSARDNNIWFSYPLSLHLDSYLTTPAVAN